MGLWTQSSVVVYRVYHGPTEMEGDANLKVHLGPRVGFGGLMTDN
jgi:hypothetical protein